jgi:hypothetical protein
MDQFLNEILQGIIFNELRENGLIFSVGSSFATELNTLKLITLL